MNVYFSDIFNISPETIEKYGAFNISLINDLPLFVDPFLLFNSNKRKYQELHNQILEYVAFLRDVSIDEGISPSLIKNWFVFSEVKQNWLGYSEIGNFGSGLGINFAKALNNNLRLVFANFGDEKITQSSHLEKLCLIKEGVGKDNISDFTTNLIKKYLLEYTQEFANRYLDSRFLKKFAVARVSFNYKTRSWESAQYNLPIYNNDFVLLTPKDILTKDETWINKPDIVDDFNDIVESIPNDQLRAEINQYFFMSLPKRPKKKGKGYKKPTKADILETVGSVLRKYPSFLDYYIRFKENNGTKATSISKERVQDVHTLFVKDLSALIEKLHNETDFYNTSLRLDTLDESYKRVLYLKDVVENKGGHKFFYIKGKPVNREFDLHVMYKLTWFASSVDVSPETNGGRGPVDFKISNGASDKTLVEFKLGSNSKLKKNLANQVEIYKKSNDTGKAIKVIFFFSIDEELKVKSILRNLGIQNEKYVVLVDARNDNKPSGSNA